MGGKGLFPLHTLMTSCIFVVEGCFFYIFNSFFFLVDLGFYFFGAVVLESVAGEKVYNTLHEAVVIIW